MMRLAIVFVGAGATVMAISVDSIYALFKLCSDLCFVILFPQLLCVVYFRWSNIYGSAAGYVAGFIVRIIGGESLIGLPAAVKFPYYDEASHKQYFPFKTLAMLVSLASIVCVSLLARFIYSFFVPKEKLDYALLNRYSSSQVKKPKSNENNEKLEVDYLANERERPV